MYLIHYTAKIRILQECFRFCRKFYKNNKSFGLAPPSFWAKRTGYGWQKTKKVVESSSLGKSEPSEPAPKPCFSALSALGTLAKSTLGGERQAPKSHKKTRLWGPLEFWERKSLQMRGEFLQQYADIAKKFPEADVQICLSKPSSDDSLLPSRTEVERISPAATPFRVFSRVKAWKVRTCLRLATKKSIENSFAAGCEQFSKDRFFVERVEFFEEYAIFKKNSAKDGGKGAFWNLVCSAPVRLTDKRES